MSDRFELFGQHAPASTLADDVRRGLTSSPRSIPPKHFYDANGSALFDRICELPEYYLTRTERRLLEQRAQEIIGVTRASALLEIGSGMARKTSLLVGALAASSPSPLYVPFDIAPEALLASAEPLLAQFETLRVRAIVGDFSKDLPRMSLGAPADRAHPRLFAFLGSTLGNLDAVEAPALVRAIAHEMTGDDWFLLGVDLVKDSGVLHAAYNDSEGITARFNKNVLAVVNRELRGDFDLEGFAHEAFFAEATARIEMHLRALRDQTVTLGALDLRVHFAAGEGILTEISRKFTRRTVESTLSEGGMSLERWYPSDDGGFALALAHRDSRG